MLTPATPARQSAAYHCGTRYLATGAGQRQTTAARSAKAMALAMVQNAGIRAGCGLRSVQRPLHIAHDHGAALTSAMAVVDGTAAGVVKVLRDTAQRTRSNTGGAHRRPLAARCAPTAGGPSNGADVLLLVCCMCFSARLQRFLSAIAGKKQASCTEKGQARRTRSKSNGSPAAGTGRRWRRPAATAVWRMLIAMPPRLPDRSSTALPLDR